MVTAPHALAVEAGIGVLRDGGNAADAIIAVAAALAVLYPHMTGIGGDAFFLFFDARLGEVHAYNGTGKAAKNATLEFYSRLGHVVIPVRGAAAALTVPGAVDAWFALHERFGSVPMERILTPAITYASDGAPQAPSFARAIAELHDVLEGDAPAAQLFLQTAPGRATAVFKNPALASTLREISRDGRRWFYEGEGARAICAHAQKIGSPLSPQDFAEHRGSYCRPAAARFFGFDSLTVPPNSQGLTLLIAQQTYEAFARQHRLEPESAGQLHAEVESIKLAIADRDRLVTDPELGIRWEHALTEEHARRGAAKIDPFSALNESSRHVDGGDTTYFAAVDAHGNAVSYIQSLFFHFGSGMVIPDLGIALQNRGTAFELTSGRLRSLEPGKRPFHTLMPCMLLRDGQPALVYGSMGGDAQPQIALQISTNIIAHGLDPQEALDRPRWRWSKETAGEPYRLHVEARMNASCIAGLAARGHDVIVLQDWEESMGHAGAILIDRSEGVLSGASDPRSDGCALGY